ncbi:MAG: ABC transporter substrate-binding protein, partial [Lachnospiraceae bacterium]|nr:ABC transporter substrate-binding protein [Lachnospiraceae bacterium]
MRKFLSAVCLAAMAASLVACGSDSGAAATTAAPAATEAAAETEAAATEAAAETEAPAEAAPAAEGGEFVIGGSGPLTGGAALYGIAVQRGGQIAVDEINAAGGINGYQVKWVFEDDEHDAEKALNAYNTLKDQGLQIMVGTVTSGPCLAVVEET